jgi:hypothetical protein
MDTKSGLRAAIVEASGDAIEFADVHAIEAQYHDDEAPGKENDWRRYWLNQRRKLSTRWIAVDVWNALADTKRGKVPEARGSCSASTVRTGTTRRRSSPRRSRTPARVRARVWERPPKRRRELACVTDRSGRGDRRGDGAFDVAELAGDPHKWHRAFEDWAVTYGDVVAEFDTTKPTLMGPACEAFEQATRPYDDTGETGLSHDGSVVLARHVGNAVNVGAAGSR